MMMDIVREIREEKKVVLLYMESGECLRFCRALWYKVPRLQPGSEVNMEELKQWMLVEQYPHALHYAVDLLAKQPRSSGEIRKKLRLRNDSENTIEMVLYKLEKEKLLDDAAFARQYAAACVRKQYGKIRILRSLLEKGVSKDVAERAVEELEEEEAFQAAVELAGKLLRRYASESDPYKARAKLLAAMCRKGYGFEESKEAVEEAQRLMMEEENKD